MLLQLVVSSPLTRALETAVGAFGGGKWQGRGSILMMDQTAIPGIRAGHDTVASVAGLPFIAFEGCRERLGPPPLCSAPKGFTEAVTGPAV